MSPSLNEVSLIGHLGKDPVMLYTKAGKPVTTFSLACNKKWKSGDGEAKERTEWVNVVAWDKLAEICNQYLRKGSLAYIRGELSTRKYDKDGATHYRTEVVASQMLMLDGRKREDASEGTSNDDIGF